MLSSIMSYIAAAGAFGIAVAVVLRNYRSFIHVVFAVGMALFGIEALLICLAAQASFADDMLQWQWYRLLASSFLPGVWLMFSISFARANYREFLSRWKWTLAGLFIVPPCLVLFFREGLFLASTVPEGSSMALIRLGWSGYGLYLVYLVSAVLILMNLEKTFRNAVGHSRWQIKFMILGLAGIFGVRVYTDSQAVLFHLLNTNFEIINVLALLLACIMIGRSLSRTGMLELDLYLSHSVIYNSFTVLIVGAYFIAIGVIARLAYYFQGAGNLPVVAFLVLAAILGLAVLLLSDKLRYKRKRFVSRHFRRPVYDYQQVWAGFTENTASLTSMKDLCLAVTTLVSHTLDVLSVSLWLIDEQQERLELGSSTILTEHQARSTGMHGEAGKGLIKLMSDQSMPIDLTGTNDDPIEQFARTYETDLHMTGVRYCVPLRATGKLIGIMTLGKRVMDQPLSFQDYELLRTMGDQSAAALLNLRLSEKVCQTKELEAFQVMSAFFMHDLKNLASKLSLVSQNMPKYYDNEEFRQDAMRTVSQSVDKIKGVCTRLSLLSGTLDINPQETRLEDLVRSTVSGMNGVLGSTVETDIYDGLPLLPIDEEQMRKVLENLLINANEAMGEDGHIRVAAGERDGWVELSVSDNGVGMTREFMEKYLFKPFQTTKKQGMGIGLFHCKTIVEAHGGRIEVESEEGKGTTFRVMLPWKK
jgi:putative PEP-CTERM system histidine kinase